MVSTYAGKAFVMHNPQYRRKNSEEYENSETKMTASFLKFADYVFVSVKRILLNLLCVWIIKRILMFYIMQNGC